MAANQKVLNTEIVGGKPKLDLQAKDLNDAAIGKMINDWLVDTSLESIDISRNNISDVGAKEIAKFIKLDTRVKSLYLKGNAITQAGYLILVDALEENFTLIECDFEYEKERTKVLMLRNLQFQALQKEMERKPYYEKLAVVLDSVKLNKSDAELVMTYTPDSFDLAVLTRVSRDIFTPVLNWTYSSLRHARQNDQFSKKKQLPLSATDVETLIKEFPVIKPQVYRAAPGEILSRLKTLFTDPDTFPRKEIFQAVIHFSYLAQVVTALNKGDKKLLGEVTQLIKKFEAEGALQDLALSELFNLINVYESNNSTNLIRVIETKEYPFPAYRFFALYLYVHILKNSDADKRKKFEKEMHELAPESWRSLLPQNIIKDANSITLISDALDTVDDSFFDFMKYFFNLFMTGAQNDTEGKLTAEKLEKYFKILDKKFPDTPYFMNNFRLWFLSVMNPGSISLESLKRYFDSIMKTATNQQKGLAFEHFCKHLKLFPTNTILQGYFEEIEKLSVILIEEEDCYGLRGIALGYLHSDINQTKNQRADELMQTALSKTTDEMFKQLVANDSVYKEYLSNQKDKKPTKK